MLALARAVIASSGSDKLFGNGELQESSRLGFQQHCMVCMGGSESSGLVEMYWVRNLVWNNKREGSQFQFDND